jgi:proteasome lid subunit RPN8/RPN11
MPQKAVWAPEQSPVEVHYRLEALAPVRDLAVAAMRRVTRGGVEVGGVLFGHHDGRQIEVSATRPIECEHRFGPGFLLSDADKDKLRQLLSTAAQDPTLRHLQVVGWYVSHTRAGIELLDRDCSLFQEFFPEPWHVTLVLRPDRGGPVRGGFFVREPGGGIKQDAAYQELELGTADPAELARYQLAAEPAPVPARRDRRRDSRAVVPALSQESAVIPVRGLEPQEPQVSLALTRLGETGVTLRGTPRPRVRKWPWLAAWATALVLLAASIYVSVANQSPEPIDLRVVERSGDLRIEWNRESRSIAWAREGLLEIRESGHTRQFLLSKGQLDEGFLTYPRQPGDLMIRLTVRGFPQVPVQETTSLIGNNAAAAAAAGEFPDAQRERMAREIRRLRDQARRQERTIRGLEQRLQGYERQRLDQGPLAPAPAPPPR